MPDLSRGREGHSQSQEQREGYRSFGSVLEKWNNSKPQKDRLWGSLTEHRVPEGTLVQGKSTVNLPHVKGPLGDPSRSPSSRGGRLLWCICAVEGSKHSFLNHFDLLPLLTPLKLAKTQVCFCFDYKLRERLVGLSESGGCCCFCSCFCPSRVEAWAVGGGEPSASAVWVGGAFSTVASHLPPFGSKGRWPLSEKIGSFLLVTSGSAVPSADRRSWLLSAKH